jgi:bacterioferritin (cytochrome b1)
VPTRAIRLTPDELGEVWDIIEKHIEIEQRTIDLAKEALDAIQGKQLLVQEYLLRYLLLDEEKHNAILEKLNLVKKGMYPYG